MKSSTKTRLIAAALLGAAVVIPIAGQHPVAHAQTVSINGQAMHSGVQPIKRNGRTLVAMRPIFEGLGASVQWDARKHSITAKSGGVSVLMTIGSPYAIVDGKTVKLDQAPLLYRGNTMVPLRFVSETMGAAVNYNAKAQRISINTGGSGASSQASAVTIRTNKPEYLPQEPIKLTFTAPAKDGIRIGLLPADIPGGDPQRNSKNSMGNKDLYGNAHGTAKYKAPKKLGTYEFRAQDSKHQLGSVAFTVIAKKDNDKRQVWADKTHVKVGEKMPYHYTSVPFQNVRINVVNTALPRGNTESSHEHAETTTYLYDSTQGKGDYVFRKPGTYEMRMDDGNGNEVAYSEPFTVSGE